MNRQHPIAASKSALAATTADLDEVRGTSCRGSPKGAFVELLMLLPLAELDSVIMFVSE